MAVAQPARVVPPSAHERRRHQRVKVSLLGRYMLSDRREFPCQVVNMSPGGVALIAPVAGVAGERVVAYIDHIGRIEGVIARRLDNGFAMTVNATLRKREKLAAQLTWLANRDVLGLPEDRRHERVVPKRAATTIIFPDGQPVPCRVIDVSLSGAAVACAERPPVGSVVILGTVNARVVRHIEEGFALEFTRLQNPDLLENGVASLPE